MIFVIADDKSLDVFDNVEAIQGACEGVDVENGVYRFFGDNGRPLKPRFIIPNEKGQSWVVSGRYDLIEDVDNKTTLMDNMNSSLSLENNMHFKTKEEIKRFLTSK